MKDLYYPTKKSKLEEYNERLKERELYTNYLFDRTIENGSGAPKHDEYGRLITKRRKYLNEDYEENLFSQSVKSPSIQINNNSNQNNNVQNNNNEKNINMYQSYTNKNSNLNINNINNNSEGNQRYNNNSTNFENMTNSLNNNQLRRQSNSNKNNIIKQNNQNEEENSKYNNNIIIRNKNNYQNNYDNIFDDNYQGLGILPRKSEDDKIKRYYEEEALKDYLKKEIEEKKLKKEMERQKQLELDIKEEIKVQKAIEEEKIQLKLEKKRKEEEEAKIYNLNLINSQQNKKKKNLIDLDEYFNKDIKFKKVNNTNENNTQNSNSQNIETINKTTTINNTPYDYNLNALENIRKLKQETVDDINNFNVNVENGNEKENIDKEINLLKNEVRNQYLEMNDLFKELKIGISEAEQYKNGKERESQIIKQELFKNRMANTLSKNLLERNYEQNMNLNYDELINKNINTIDSNINLQGKSNFIYFDNENRDENENNNDNMSMNSLAMAGKNVIELKGENELIPINNNIENEQDMNVMDNLKNMDRLALINEERKNEEENNKKGIMMFKMEMERERLLNNDFDKPCTMDDLYKELNIIESINQTFSPINKIQSLKNNFGIDYGENKKKETKKKK